MSENASGNRLKRDLKQKVRENDTLKTKVARLKKTNECLGHEIRQLRGERDSLRKEGDIVDAEMARLRQELEEQRALVHRMKTQPPVPQLPYGLPERPTWTAPELAQEKRKRASSEDSHPAKRSKTEDSRVQTRPQPAVSNVKYKPKLPLGSPTTVYRDDAISLSDTDAKAYLQHTFKFPISPAPIASAVFRHILQPSFGIPLHSSPLDQIPAAKNPSGNRPRNLWFMNSAGQPGEPQIAGSSGLVFGFNPGGRDPTQGGPWSVFRRYNRKTWSYMGEYDNSLVESLSKEQFCAQKDVAQKRWAATYSKHYMTWETLLAFQGRAILRRSGVDDPTVLADRAQVAKMVAERFPKESSLPPPPVREREIIDAFKRGDERVSVIRMQCVGYDHAFIRHVDEVCFAAKQGELERKTGPQKGFTGNVVNGSTASNAGSHPSRLTTSAVVSSASRNATPPNAGPPANPVSAIPLPSEYEPGGPWSKPFVPKTFESSTSHLVPYHEPAHLLSLHKPTPPSDTIASRRTAFENFLQTNGFPSSGTREARALCNSVPRKPPPPTASSSAVSSSWEQPPSESAVLPVRPRIRASTLSSTSRLQPSHSSLSVPEAPGQSRSGAQTPIPLRPSVLLSLPTSPPSAMGLSYAASLIDRAPLSVPFTEPPIQDQNPPVLSQTATSSLRSLWTNPMPGECIGEYMAAAYRKFEPDLDEFSASDNEESESELEYP